ncbi:MAG: carbohydrate ABC transporter permease, partial [Bacillota bacterium]|nr:carbohydrate ABC transporter permease [Bacillota bacterium]
MRKLRNLMLYLFSALCVLPILVVLFASLRGPSGAPSLSGYLALLFRTPNFYRGFWLSLAYSASIVSFSVVVSMTSAYGLVRYAFRGSRVVLWAYILLMLLPFQATLVPQYFALRWMGIHHSPAAVILPGVFSTFGAVMIAQYMRGLDHRLFDAARLDGMNDWQMFVRLALPLCRPIAMGLLFILFVGAWSMVEQPLVFLQDLRQMPLSVSIRMDKRVRSFAYAAGIMY